MKQVVLPSVYALLLLALAGCGANNDTAKLSSLEKDNASLKSEVSSLKASGSVSTTNHDDDDLTTSKVATHKLGEEALIANNTTAKAVGLTITAADQDWTAFAKRQGDRLFQGNEARTIQLRVKYTNYALADDFQPDEDDFLVYAGDDSAAQPLDIDFEAAEVTAGHSSTTTLWYQFNKPYKQLTNLTIEYAPDGKPLAKWTVD